MNEYSLEDFKEWLNKKTWNSGARTAEEMIVEFEKEQEEKPTYYVVHEDPENPDIESFDVRKWDSSYQLGYEDIAVFYKIELPDAEKRAKALCDELNQKEKPTLGQMLMSSPPRCGRTRAWDLGKKPTKPVKLLIIDDPSRDIVDPQKIIVNILENYLKHPVYGFYHSSDNKKCRKGLNCK